MKREFKYQQKITSENQRSRCPLCGGNIENIKVTKIFRSAESQKYQRNGAVQIAERFLAQILEFTIIQST